MAEEKVSVEPETTRYEMMMIILPNLGDDATQKELDEIRSLLSSHGGNIFHEDIWGNMDLAYTIKKQDQGYYIVWNLDLPTDQMKEIETALNINQAVVRYMFVKIPQEYEFKALSVYKEEFEEERKRLAEAQENEKAAAAQKRKPAEPKPKKIVAKKPEVTKEEPAKTVEEKAEEPKKAKKDNLEDVDAKLKSIISDPDISL